MIWCPWMPGTVCKPGAFASYAWLYIGSWIMGLGAFLIALTFRPFLAAKAEPEPAPA